MDFASDNTSAVTPEIMAALVAANAGTAPAYGADGWSAVLDETFGTLFEREVRVFPVSTGTAANALGLAAVTPPYGAVFCHEGAHILADECGAPEFFTAGAKLVPVAGVAGKVTVPNLERALALYRPGIVHEVQPAALSLSQATEAGTIYTPEEVRALAVLARSRGMAVHMDGARLANALVTLDCAPADITWRAGVDVLAFGATKNGALAAEAVVVFDRARADDLAFRRKRAGHLLSKGRFLAAQLLAYVEGGRWLGHARHANDAAARLAAGLASTGAVRFVYPCQVNELFVAMAPALAERLWAEGARFHPWVAPGLEGQAVYRLVTSWMSDEETIERFLSLVRAAASALSH